MTKLISPSQKLFKSIRKISIIVSIISLLMGIGVAIALHTSDFTYRKQNETDNSRFIAAKQDIDKANNTFMAKFSTQNSEALNTKMAQRGHLALLDISQTQQLFGYKEIQTILTTQTMDNSAEGDTPRKYVFPEINIAGLVLSPQGNSCTTLVRYSYKGQTQNLMWKWERKDKNDKWKTNSLPNEFSARDIEITRTGISFVLVSKETLISSPVYTLQSGAKGQNNDTKKVDIKIVNP